MSNSRSVSETELDSNSDHKTEHTTHYTGSSNTTKGSVTQPEYEHSRALDNMSSPNIVDSNNTKGSETQPEYGNSTTDSVSRSEYEHTYVHSLKTLAYLAWVGWPKPKDKETNPIQDITKDCECGCIINGVHIAKPHFRVRN